MSFYEENKKEIRTLHLISQILGKIKLEYSAQEPQWAHVILDINSRGFSTGLLKHEDIYFEIGVNLVDSSIEIRTKDYEKYIELENGKSVSDYYNEIMDTLNKVGLPLSIQTKPQEMEWKVPFDQDFENSYYDRKVAREILQWFQFAWDVEQELIAPLRQRKVYPGLFWGTFDVSCILLYKQMEAFPDDSKIIERAAFDEHMIEFGFWLGDGNFEYPTFFILPYPFVQNVELEIDESFPKGSYFSSDMAEYIYEMKDGMGESEKKKVISFMSASNKKSMEYLGWEETDYYSKKLKMEKNKKR